MRYKVIEDSQSGHCCFDWTVVDTETPHSVYASLGLFEAVCECFEKEQAKLVCAALNLLDTTKS